MLRASARKKMRAAFGRLALLWIALHVVAQTHGDDPNTTTAPHHLRNQGRIAGGGIYLLYPLILVLAYFSDNQVERRELRREQRRCRWSLPSDCLCREEQLVRAVRENRQAKICQDTTINISREIDITGKSFTISCAKPKDFYRGSCKILGSGNHRLFYGSPANATLQGIDLENGFAGEGGIALINGGNARFLLCEMTQSRATGNGGAIRITGGHVEVNAALRNNSAVGDGGAISASGSSAVVTLSSSMEFNNATNGGALSVVDGAQIRCINFPCSFSSNIAKANGGAFYIRNTTVDMTIISSDNAAGSQGDSLYVKNSKLVLRQSTFKFDTASNTRSNDIWIDDDDDPSGSGSFVSCIGTKGELDLGEIAAGSGQTQNFRNCNCTQRTRRPMFGPATPVKPASWPSPVQPIPPSYGAIVFPPS
jgi:predicted outer membrane repeat protein